MFATAVVVVCSYSLELIYGSAFLLTCLAAAILAKWSIKSLLLFMMIVAVLFMCCKTAKQISESNIVPTYTYCTVETQI